MAYLVPLIESLQHWKTKNGLAPLENAPFAIILAPTRELVSQIEVSEVERENPKETIDILLENGGSVSTVQCSSEEFVGNQHRSCKFPISLHEVDRRGFL